MRGLLPMGLLDADAASSAGKRCAALAGRAGYDMVASGCCMQAGEKHAHACGREQSGGMLIRGW